ncbi:DUF5123 domain-containing protein [Flavobacterium aquidurense]|uniref:DUF5123 domain-containing protein n=1 Tax=Flavobacterium aquidurense TaxID=362413 RepID=UPI0028629171|nr:DUF5123 domain-containing protein [Flavobacterium aquidurense]MDR7370298.1 hypothetical protein [Flavobacterium aquidurense]
MKKNIVLGLFSLLAIILVSCEKDYNDWEVVAGHERLFKSLIFEVSKVESTEVELKFTKSIDATKYVFEFSKDSLLFNQIVKTVELSSSDLVPFAASTNQTKIEYREIFKDLDGDSKYSVRMKSINEITGLESKLSQMFFKTPAEQLFKSYTPAANSITIEWTISPRVTAVVLYDQAGTSIREIPLTEQQKAAGTLTIDNLAIGTSYVVKILNASNVRGSLNVRTTGILDSTIYNVLPGDNAATIAKAISDLVAAGSKNFTVVFDKTTSYNIGGDITIPTGVNDIAFAGVADSNGTLPKLLNARFRVQTQINDLIIQYLNTTSAAAFFIDLGTKNVHNINIDGCEIDNINSIVRLSGASVINDINVTNSKISKTGGYGVFNVASGQVINSITVQNCTLTEISTRFADVRVATKINFSNITCVNITTAMGHLWLFDNAKPVQLTIQNMIIGGPNGGAKINSTNGNYASIPISYTGSYMTKDLIVDARPLTGITAVPLDIYGLFVNPAAGDFHIKEGTGFAGTGIAGDKRWF